MKKFNVKKILLTVILSISATFIYLFAQPVDRPDCLIDADCPKWYNCVNGRCINVYNNYIEYPTYCESCDETSVPSCLWSSVGEGGPCTPGNCTICKKTQGGYLH